MSRYRESGPLGMANRRRGKPSNNQLPDGFAQYALSIIRERYTDFGPTLACEKLAELHDVHLSKETVRSLMVKAGLWIPRKQRAPKIQQPRYRRACCGELIQIDGCDHHWFENRAPACTALVYVDDATSRLMQLRFVKSESTFTYFEATGAIWKSMASHWHCTAIKPASSELTIKTQPVATATPSLGVRCTN